LRNPFTIPLTNFLEHQFWFPLARLSYGAYLSAGIFMLYRTFNMERGMWACELDSFFLFMAYLSFAYLFSFVITVLVELPCHNLYTEFITGRSEMAAVSYNRGIASKSLSKRGSRISDEDASDAETLDTVDEAENPSDSFITN
jgi:hypothetical protein